MSRDDYKPRCRVMLETVFDGRGGKNSKAFHLEIDPLDATVGLNGYYEADTWDLDFDANLFPFDPDQLAYGACRIYMWDANALEQYGGSWDDDDNLMVNGLVDNIASQLIGDDRVVKLEGRDHTGLLADPEWDPRDKVRAGGSLLEVVQSLADEAAPPNTRARFEVVWEVDDIDPDEVICGGSRRSTKKKGLNIKPGKSYWDVIYDLCIDHSFVPRVVGKQIIIGNAVTETKQTLKQAPRLVYGKHLESLSIERKFGREKVPQIKIVKFNPETGEKIEVVYPEKRNIDVQAFGSKTPSTDALGIPLTVKKDDVLEFPGPEGVYGREDLKRYARLRFYHLGRGETTYKFKTGDLLIDGGHSPIVDPFSKTGREINLLQLRPGRAIGIHFEQFNETYLRTLDNGSRIDHIVSLGYDREIAVFVANNLDRMELFKQDYYFNRGTVSYNHEDGVEIEIEAANFAGEVREIQFAEDQVPTARQGPDRTLSP